MRDGIRSQPIRHLVLLSRIWVDVAAVVAVVVALGFAIYMDSSPLIRVPLAFVVTFVAPGYLLVLAVFPRAKTLSNTDQADSTLDGGITGFDRAVLSVVASFSLVVCGGLVLNTLNVPLTTEPFLGMLAAVTGVMLPFAIYRRRRTPKPDRYIPWYSTDRENRDRSSQLIQFDLFTAILIVSIVFAGGSIAYSAQFEENAGVTEFYFEFPTVDGESSEAIDPTNMTVGQETQFDVSIGNREGERMQYTVIGQLQEVRNGDDGLIVQGRERIYTGTVNVPSGETENRPISFMPETAGEYRLVFLLFVEDAPAEPRIDSAYREIHLWINVSEPSNTTAS
ncbi:DUF1616 domain-containing protein [Halobaculum limi]|uniref:DUF1616 domain-containing protein n=1 Tax=Halobaculum limi TaxID=3031916 RepID=UPI00240510AF|nr:DUF1616 domain-containing protein [Halobaculum sp. YSMS11]